MHAHSSTRKTYLPIVALLEPDETYEELGWPSAFGPTGEWAAYVKSGDIVLLNLRNSGVSAVAITDEEESSVSYTHLRAHET